MNMKRNVAALALFLILTGTASAEELEIIVNAKNTVGVLNMAEIRKYFLKEHGVWPNGEKVRSVDRFGRAPEKRIFLEKVVKMSDDQLEQFWISKRYEKGTPVPPKLHSDQEVIEYVLSFDGAIGYVSSGSIGSKQRPQLKVIGSIPAE